MRTDKVLLFDLGGVLVRSEGLEYLSRLAPLQQHDSLIAKWRTSCAVDLFEKGKISPEEFGGPLCQRVGLSMERSAIFPMLGERRSQAAGTMSGGEQQMCSIGRGLMSAPRLLMIDELSLGLSPLLVEQLVEALAALNREGLTVLVVEQDVMTALEVSSEAYVMDTGRIVKHGSSHDLLLDPAVRTAYLGALAA